MVIFHVGDEESVFIWLHFDSYRHSDSHSQTLYGN
jgi:hypothetical protein